MGVICVLILDSGRIQGSQGAAAQAADGLTGQVLGVGDLCVRHAQQVVVAEDDHVAGLAGCLDAAPGGFAVTADLQDKGVALLVIKHGKQGSRAYSKYDGNWDVKPFPVDALKGFGGGDGYASAFIHGLLQGKKLNEALEMGSASAAMLVASHACSRDMPTEEALMTFIAEKKSTCGEVVTKI